MVLCKENIWNGNTSFQWVVGEGFPEEVTFKLKFGG